MEVYVNEAHRPVSIEMPVDAIAGSMTVEILVDGQPAYEMNTVTATDTGYSIQLPFHFAQSDRKVVVHWRFSYVEDGSTYEYDRYQDVDVVTPILSITELKDILDDDATTEEATALERAVRMVIQAHCGQSFGMFIGKRTITGSGDTNLRMPQKLIEIKTVNGNRYLNAGLAIRGGGWYIVSKAWGVPSLKADFHGYHENPYTSPVPILGPNSQLKHVFLENMEYEIDGIWGWSKVPPEVSEAARLLANDYACADSNYRDRFLTSMTAADWRIQFHDGAFSNTGNVRANQLLTEFVLRRGWVVI